MRHHAKIYEKLCRYLCPRTEDGRELYRNAFAGSLAIDDADVTEVMASGRARWNIEDENNNTLKTKGLTTYQFTCTLAEI